MPTAMRRCGRRCGRQAWKPPCASIQMGCFGQSRSVAATSPWASASCSASVERSSSARASSCLMRRRRQSTWSRMHSSSRRSSTRWAAPPSSRLRTDLRRSCTATASWSCTRASWPRRDRRSSCARRRARASRSCGRRAREGCRLTTSAVERTWRALVACSDGVDLFDAPPCALFICALPALAVERRSEQPCVWARGGGEGSGREGWIRHRQKSEVASSGLVAMQALVHAAVRKSMGGGGCASVCRGCSGLRALHVHSPPY
mmetsp:Transcript_26609/g.67642  ORF Transcript_26609/g.67642 Transcript_26609/m.67642 type:complete len:261 (+) Transcript_26609:3362-4144(+)